MTDRKRTPAQERVIRIITRRAEFLGRCPRKGDMTQEELAMIRKAFDKWVYALEAADLRAPSQATLDRRRNKQLKWKRKHFRSQGQKEKE